MYPGEIPVADRTESNQKHGKSEHIFTYLDGEIEVSKEFLLELLKYFDDSKNRKNVFGDYKNLGE